MIKQTFDQVIRRRRRTRLDRWSAADRHRLRRFNGRLAALEHVVLAEAIPVDRSLRVRLDDEADRLFDYELEAVVSYTLRNDDPDFQEGKPNLLAQRDYYLKGIAHEVTNSGLHCARLADGINHNDFAGWAGNPLQDECHCWMYHDLYDHGYGEKPPYREVDWGDLLRIGEVSWCLQITQQYCPNWSREQHFWIDLPHGFHDLPRFTKA